VRLPAFFRDNPNRYPLGYHAGLDGLRGTMTLGVLAAHLRESWCPGAFVYMDTFFLMSAYLITALLLKGWKREGQIDFGRFYLRRSGLLSVRGALAGRYGRTFEGRRRGGALPFELDSRLRNSDAAVPGAYLVAVDRGAVLPALAAAPGGLAEGVRIASAHGADRAGAGDRVFALAQLAGVRRRQMRCCWDVRWAWRSPCRRCARARPCARSVAAPRCLA
jgi:hypothetical protein